MSKRWKSQYRKMLYDTSITMHDISKYIEKNIPRYLYKYRSFDSYWKSILYEGLVYFPDSSTLNDPFDCYTYIDIKKYSEFMNRFASKYVFPWISLSDIEKAYNTYIENSINLFCKNMRKNMLLTCFSEVCNSILMWAHYAESHKGFCIEYDTEKIDIEYKRFLFPVIYQNEVYDYTETAIMNNPSYASYMEIIKMRKLKTEYEFIDVSNNIYIPMLTKAKEWDYEQEWRIVVPSDIFGKNKHFIYLGDAISSIYLGTNCDENSQYINEIINWAKGKKINVYKMNIEPSKYRIINSLI